MQGLFGGVEARLKQWLREQHGDDWYVAHDIGIRTFNDLIHDGEIRPTLTPFNHQVLAGFAVAADKAEEERKEVLRDFDDGKDFWGKAIDLPVPSDVQPFSAIEKLPKLLQAIAATTQWVFGLKSTVDQDGNDEYYPSFLVLNGIPGCGKTMLAKAAYHALTEKGRPVLFLTERAFIAVLHRALESKSLDEVQEELMGIPNFILDDYGAAALASGTWAHSKRDEVLSARWENEMATMITTNLQSEAIRADSARLASRLMDKTRAVNVAIAAEDYRQRVR